MSEIALLVRHKTKDNCRELVQQIWQKHMRPAILNSADHLSYFYCFNENQPNEICAFQSYTNTQALVDFQRTDAFLKYLKEVDPLLEHPPELTSLAVYWKK